MNFFDMGFMEILVILLVILLVFGPEKIPDIARTLGKTMNNLKKMSSDMATRVKEEIDAENSHADDDTEESEKERKDDTGQ